MARITYVKPTYGQHKIIFTKREAFVTFVLSLEVGTNCTTEFSDLSREEMKGVNNGHCTSVG